MNQENGKFNNNISINFKRWYEKDPIVSKCFEMMEKIDDGKKRRTATFLMNEIISMPPYSSMLTQEIFNLATSEENKRRWYDFDEVSRIFTELLRHSPDETKNQIAIKAIQFIEDLG